MAANGPDPEERATEESGAGTPARGAAEVPTEEELDARERDKARPRRASGPPLGDESAEAVLDAVAHEPPPATEPGDEGEEGGAPASDGEGGGAETGEGDAGRPADHAGPKPSSDELDRRDRRGAAPRRAAGPPLGPEGLDEALRDAQFHEPPPATDPEM